MDNILIGRIITELKIADDKKALLFITNYGNVIVKTDGDCCSNTWIEHIELPVNGFPATVTNVEEIDMPNLTVNRNDDEVIAYYGCKITTDKGILLIDYRNESNGYYGGNLSWPSENSDFYGGVYGQNISTEKWVEINSNI